MRRAEKWMLTGAWTAMAVAVAFSFYKVSEAPTIDPTVARLCVEVDQAQTRGPDCRLCPEPLPRNPTVTCPGPKAGYLAPVEGSDRFHTTCIGHPVLPKDREILVLPFPVMDAVRTDQDGSTLTWSLEDRPVEHKSWMIPKSAKPTSFAVYRESVLGQPEKLADLGPSARAFTDLSTEPRKTYFYWVSLTGLETDRSNNEGTLLTVTNKADRPLQTLTPSATRVKLIGGDRTRAVLRTETYDRATKAWISKTVLAAPGEMVAGTGWSLKSLRFDEFTLVAEVTDGDGAARVLSTRN